MGVPPPLPPPNVPAIDESPEAAKASSLRQKMEIHRGNPTCAACHRIMDPIGFTLENFDLVGRWRTRDGNAPIDATSQLFDGTPLDGPVSLRKALLARSDVFVRTATEKLMTYGTGRALKYYDMPVVRHDRARRREERLSLLVARARHREERSVSDEDESSRQYTVGRAVHSSRREPGTEDRPGDRRRTMAFITKKHLPRRTFLRGVGATIALPLLDSMVAAQTPIRKTAAAAKSRLSCIYVPHGATMDKWTPAGDGQGLRVHRDPRRRSRSSATASPSCRTWRTRRPAPWDPTQAPIMPARRRSSSAARSRRATRSRWARRSIRSRRGRSVRTRRSRRSSCRSKTSR